MRQSAIHQVLGPAFDILPRAVREAHDHDGVLTVTGLADTETADSWLGRMMCLVIGLPRAGKGQRVTVTLETDAQGRDYWRRNFNGRRYKSRLCAGRGRQAGYLVEYQGPMQNVFALTATPDQLNFELVGFGILGIPLPRFLSPGCTAFESEQDGQFIFTITINAPLVGWLTTYKGVTRVAISGTAD